MKFSWADRRTRAAVILVLVAGSVSVALLTRSVRPRPTARPAVARGSADELVIAAAGDSAPRSRVPLSDAGVAGVAALLRPASAAVTNFEASAGTGRPANVDEEPRWPAAAPTAAVDLRDLGFTAVSLANNHVADYGVDGIHATEQQLDRAGLAHAGTGADLAEARAPVFIDTPAGRVALISVAASHAPVARAAASHGEIKGRPGLSPLRYSRIVTVTDTVFASLKRNFASSERAAVQPDGTFTMFGTTIRHGDRNSIELVADPADVDGIVEEVKRARTSAAVVVLSVHAHEPGNLLDTVPDFLTVLAHKAIDAGASMVVGHGPHRLRGVELYDGKPILYSLGNFIFEDQNLDPAAADVFEDSSENLLAGSSAEASGERATLDFSDDVWWESVVARAHFRHGQLERLELIPLDLGVGQDKSRRGIPRVARPEIARNVLLHLNQLSAPFGVQIALVNGVGIVRSPHPSSP